MATDLLMRGQIPGDPTFTALGKPPVATVQLIVTLSILLGLDHGVGQIPGWGCVSRQQAQDLALQLGSIWKRVVTDPLTARAIEATAGTYTVPAVHRGHHNLKTSGFWDSDQLPEGVLRWTTATGRTFTTYPYVYDHPDNLPIRSSNLEAHLGRRLAPVINPDIRLPGQFSIFDHIDWTQALTPATAQLPRHTWETAQANQRQREANMASRDPGPPPF